MFFETSSKSSSDWVKGLKERTSNTLISLHAQVESGNTYKEFDVKA